jgi:urease accessory protein
MIYFTHRTTDNNATEQVTLPWSKRTRSRLRIRLHSGEEAGLLLERGEVLRHNDCLRTEDGQILKVMAAEELVSSISCTTPLQLARICYHLGNRHIDLEIRDDEVRYPHDHVLDDMVRGMGFIPETISALFEPESGAYETGTSTKHSHSHD